MAQITVFSQNPLAIPPEQLADFVSEVQSALPQLAVTAGDGPQMRGYGVTWWEVVRVTIENLPADLIALAVEASLVAGGRWMKRRYKHDAAMDRRPRPRIVIVQGADGKEIGTATLRNGHQKPMSREADAVREEKRVRAEASAKKKKKKNGKPTATKKEKPRKK